jgi:hypothetical protein
MKQKMLFKVAMEQILTFCPHREGKVCVGSQGCLACRYWNGFSYAVLSEKPHPLIETFEQPCRFRAENKPLFKTGDKVVVSVKGKAEDGMHGTIDKALPYDGPKSLDNWMYTAKDGWRWRGTVEVVAAIPERWLKNAQ